MSAFVVDKTHIDALVTAGLKLAGHYGPMSWFEREISEEDESDAYQAGEPWGPRAVELAQQLTRKLTYDTAGRVGAMLWAENVRSVNHRYDEAEWEEPYEFSMLPGDPDPVVVLKAIACYEYQSCEHPEWRRSEAKRFCEALTEVCIGRLKGYGEAPWEISDRDIFRKAVAR